MTQWTTIRQFNTRRFAVALQYDYDRDADIASYDAPTRAGIARGDYFSYVFRVVVLLDGREMGADYLGDSLYSNPEEFAREHLGILPKARTELPPGGVYCVYFPDMLRTAVREARHALAHAPRMRGAV